MGTIGFKSRDSERIAKKHGNRDFKFCDDGKDRGEHWRHPIIKLQTQCKWYSENRHINFEVAEKIWKKRLSDADSKPPGVPSDLLNFRYTGKFPSAEIEYYDLVLAQEGDKRAIDKLVKRFQPLVARVVFGDRKSKDKKKRRRYYGLPDEELIDIAQTGLFKAIYGFKMNSGNRFATYAEHKIRSALDDALRGTNQAERALYANPNATLDELVELSGLSMSPRFLKRTYDKCADAMAKKIAEDTMAFYDPIESGVPAEVDYWANFGDDNAPGHGDSDNTAFFEARTVVDSTRDYIEPEAPEEPRIGPLLSESDLADHRRSDKPHRCRVQTSSPEALARLMSRIDSEPRIERASPEWFAANYPRFRQTEIDIIPNDPITSRMTMEGIYESEATTIVPVEGSEFESAELAGTPGD